MIISPPNKPSGFRRTLQQNGEDAVSAIGTLTTGTNTKTIAIAPGATVNVFDLVGRGAIVHLSLLSLAGSVSNVDIDTVLDGVASTFTVTNIANTADKVIVHGEMRNQTYSTEPVTFDSGAAMSVTNNDGVDTVQLRYKYYID
ncbi:MAG: hypothetical protein AB2696_21180 [Candidatus Thiodiazotropha sp.]